MYVASGRLPEVDAAPVDAFIGADNVAEQQQRWMSVELEVNPRVTTCSTVVQRSAIVAYRASGVVPASFPIIVS